MADMERLQFIVDNGARSQYAYTTGIDFGRLVVVASVKDELDPPLDVSPELYGHLEEAMDDPNTKQFFGEYYDNPAFLIGALAGAIEQIRGTE